MAKTTRASKTSKINMAAVAEIDLNTADDSAILASMFEDDAPEEIELAETDLIEDVVADEDMLAVAAEIEKAEAITALYDEADPADLLATVSEADTPKTEADAEPVAKKAKKEKVAKAPKEPKALRPTSHTHQPGDLLLAKLGENAKDYLVFETADAALDSGELALKVNEFIARMNDRDAIADKVREKAIQLFTWVKSGGKLNEVLERTFKVLARDGELTSGAKGNLQTDLLSKPYSPGTAASQANQMFMLLPELKVTMKEKGRMVLNPESLIFMKAKAELSLS